MGVSNNLLINFMGVILSFINTLWNDLRETSFKGKIFTYQNNKIYFEVTELLQFIIQQKNKLPIYFLQSIYEENPI